MPPSTACMESVNPCSPSTALELLALVPQFLHLCSTSCFRLELCDSATRMAYFMSCPPPRPCFAAPLSAMWPQLTFPALSSPSSLPVWQVPTQTPNTWTSRKGTHVSFLWPLHCCVLVTLHGTDLFMSPSPHKQFFSRSGTMPYFCVHFCFLPHSLTCTI